MSTVRHDRSNHTTNTVLSEKYKELCLCLEDYCTKMTTRVFLLIEKELRSKLSELADINSVFSSCDENTFTYCQQLMDSYKKIIALISSLQASIDSEPVKSIFLGIVSIFESRLNYFNELASNGCDPVYEEKIGIINEASNMFSNNFHILLGKSGGRIIRECTRDGLILFYNGFDYDSAVEFSDFVLKRNALELSELIYSLFIRAYTDCIQVLDSMDKRRQMSFYYDLLKNEYNEFSIIIKKQILEIESKMLEMEKDSGEYNSVFEILTLFRQVYQYTGKLLNDIDECFENTRTRRFNEYTFDEFKEYIISFASGDKTISTIECDSTSVVFNEKLTELKLEYKTAFKSITSSELAETSLGHVIYHIKKYVSDNSMMVEDLKSAFHNVLQYFEEKEQELSGYDNFDIVKGIYDTVKIKTECLEDNKEILNETAKQLIESNKDIIPSLTNAEMEKFINIGIKDWFESKTPAPDFDELKNGDEYKLFAEKRKKHHDMLLDKVNKKSIEYKKDYLLFEISTYEEIMNYSVSRLKSTENPEILDFATVCDNAFNELTTALKRNNISSIIPAPHDMFNAREHEVLMAEKNEEFLKGEIIKLMNSGYKQDDVIIMRANVIAAK